MSTPGIDPPEMFQKRKPMVRLSPDPFKLTDIIAPVLITITVMVLGWLLLRFFFFPRIFG